MEIATGAAQPIVGRDRESVVIYQMSTKEEQFTDVQVTGSCLARSPPSFSLLPNVSLSFVQTIINTGKSRTSTSSWAPGT